MKINTVIDQTHGSTRFQWVQQTLSLLKSAGAAAALFWVIGLTSVTAQAQDQKKPQGDLSEMKLEDLMKVEVESVYSASKFLQKVTDAPASISIVTADEIRRYGYRTLADILRSVRGFYTSYDRNYTYLGMRGFARPGDYNTRVLVLVDGHRVNDNIYDGAYIGTEFPIDVDLIERVEVVHGPSSSLYGGSAFLAVVNVITKRARSLDGLEVSGEAASFDTYKTRLSYGRKFRNGLDLLLSGSFYDSGGPHRLYFKELDSPETNDGVAINADDDQFGSVFANLAFRDVNLQGAYVRREKGIPTGAWETALNHSGSRTVDERGYVDLLYEHTFDYQWKVATRLFYDRYHYYGTYVADGGDGATFYPNEDLSRGDWWGIEPALTRTFFDGHKVTAGGEFRHHVRQDQMNYDGTTSDVYIDVRRESKNWALYAQDEFAIARNLLINAGVRHDHYESFGGTTNPRLGLIYHPFERTSVKALYGQAFRPPNVYEMFYADDSLSKPSLDLRPESIKTGEVALEQYLGSHLRLSASAFRYKIKGLISQQTDEVDGRIIFRNVEGVETDGLGLELETRWANGLSGRASYSFQGVQDEATGEVLSNSPRHLGKVNVTLPLAPKKLFAGVEVQYMSPRRTLAGDYSDHVALANVTLFSQKLLKGLEVSASVYNLFDERYGDPGAEEHRQRLIEQDGRTVRVKFTYRF